MSYQGSQGHYILRELVETLSLGLLGFSLFVGLFATLQFQPLPGQLGLGLAHVSTHRGMYKSRDMHHICTYRYEPHIHEFIFLFNNINI